jgi:hypothetical protein
MLSGQARDRHLHRCRIFYRFGFQQAMLYCTMHPSGSRFSIFIALVKMSRASESHNSYDSSSLLVFTSHPCPLLRTQKMTGSRPCPRASDNSHGLRVPAFQWLTAWSVKMESSDPSGVERVANQLGWFGQHKHELPRSSPSLKRTFSPPGKKHDLS